MTNLVIPAFFTALGAGLGFVASEIKDHLQTKRSKRAFFRAVGVELTNIKTNLQDVVSQADVFVAKLQLSGHAPQLLPQWGTTVFDTQLGKLRDVADALILECIEVYAMVGRIGQISVAVNDWSREFVNAKPGDEKATVQARLNSTLRVLGEEAAKAVARTEKLLQKLPAN